MPPLKPITEKYICPRCSATSEETYTRMELIKPRLKLCWFCQMVKGEDVVMDLIKTKEKKDGSPIPMQPMQPAENL